MDLKVYQKETVTQPQGNINVLKPGIIDIYPVLNADNELIIQDAEIVDGQEEILQQSALVTIFQRGLDPIDLKDGIEWGELMRDEVSPPQVIAELQAAVANVSNTANITFSTVKDKNGVERLSFELRAI